MTHPSATEVEDKHGHPIHIGDVVSFVYGGNHHRMVVEGIERIPESLLFHLHGHIDVAITAQSAARHEKRHIASAETAIASTPDGPSRAETSPPIPPTLQKKGK